MCLLLRRSRHETGNMLRVSFKKHQLKSNTDIQTPTSSLNSATDKISVYTVCRMLEDEKSISCCMCIHGWDLRNRGLTLKPINQRFLNCFPDRHTTVCILLTVQKQKPDSKWVRNELNCVLFCSNSSCQWKLAWLLLTLLSFPKPYYFQATCNYGRWLTNLVISYFRGYGWSSI